MTANAPSKVKPKALPQKPSPKPSAPGDSIAVHVTPPEESLRAIQEPSLPDWNDIPRYVLDAFLNIGPDTVMSSELAVGFSLRITYTDRNSVVWASFNVGRKADRDGISMTVHSCRTVGNATYTIEGTFGYAELQNAPNARALYDYLVGKLSIESIGGTK